MKKILQGDMLILHLFINRTFLINVAQDGHNILFYYNITIEIICVISLLKIN